MNKKVIAMGLALSTMVLPVANVQAKKITSTAQAEKLAKKHVKGATVLFTEKDEEDGVQVYEVDLKKGSTKYELVYKASNGKLIEYKWEKKRGKKSSKKVSEKEIRRLAEKKIKNARIVETDYDSDDAEYEVDMTGKNKKYELAYTPGGILVSYKWEKL